MSETQRRDTYAIMITVALGVIGFFLGSTYWEMKANTQTIIELREERIKSNMAINRLTDELHRVRKGVDRLNEWRLENTRREKRALADQP